MRVGKVRKLLPPIVPLLPQQFSKPQQIPIPCAVVKPHHAQDFILPTIFAPIAERALGHFAGLKRKIALHQRNDTGIAGRFLILGQHLEHHHPRPPVVVFRWTDHAVGLLML